MGELRSEGEQATATIHLVESETGQDVWSRVYRYTPETRKYALTQIANAGFVVVQAEARRPLPEKPEAGHLAILAFMRAANLPNAAAVAEALELTERALRLDPNSVPALLTFGWASTLVRGAPAEEQAARLERAQEAIDRAITQAPRDAVGYFRRSQVLRARGDMPGALKANHQALLHNPLFGLAHAELGRDKIDAGLAHETIAHIEEAFRLSPGNSATFFWCWSAGRAAVHIGNHEEALRWLQKAQQTAPPGDWDRVVVPWLAVAQAGVGREDEGRALIKGQVAAGRLTLAQWRKKNPRGSGVLAEQRARIEDLLRRLGVPEGNVQTGAVQ